MSSEEAADLAAAHRTRSAREILAQYRTKGLGSRVGYGARPAIIVIDFIRGFTDPSSPLGSDLDNEVQATVRLLEVARSRGRHVLFTTTAYDDDAADGGLFPAKVPSLRILRRGSEWIELDRRLERRESETSIEKQYASAFFGTGLAEILTELQVDTLLVTGCTTSGCVRATVVDALQYGFRAIVPHQCVGDRASEPHIANLVDIDSKYGDVVEVGEALEYLQSS